MKYVICYSISCYITPIALGIVCRPRLAAIAFQQHDAVKRTPKKRMENTVSYYIIVCHIILRHFMSYSGAPSRGTLWPFKGPWVSLESNENI